MIGHNALLVSTPEFNPLAAKQLTVSQAGAVDRRIAKAHASHFGLMKNDPAHVLYIPVALAGKGLHPLSILCLMGKARELKIYLNGLRSNALPLQGHLTAADHTSPTPNLILACIRDLAEFGYWLRDLDDIWTSLAMEILLTKDRDHRPPLGMRGHHPHYTSPAATPAWITTGNK